MSNSNSTFRKTLNLAKRYFIQSEERYVASALLAGAILTVIAMVVLTAAFSWWITGFWAALMAMNSAMFASSMAAFAGLVTCLVLTNTLKSIFTNKLSINWRSFLTKSLLSKYLQNEHGDNNNYLDLSRSPEHVDNPQQRIQEDVSSFVESTISLSLDFLGSTLKLVAFIGTLWVVGGTLSLILFSTAITIPGYLVFVAIALSITATFITYKLGKNLPEINNEQQQNEAEFRAEISALSEKPESVALEGGEKYYSESLTAKLQSITKVANTKLVVNSKLTAFKSFFGELSRIIPYVAASPLYFMGLIELGQLMQVGFSFHEVNSSLTWFSSSYEQLSSYKASINRITQLEDALLNNDRPGSKKGINVEQRHGHNCIQIEDLNIQATNVDQSTTSILKILSLKFMQGENTLLKGPSGLGKSTLFKAIAGTWQHGSGKIITSAKNKMCFLAQKPSMPNNTLKAILAYPCDVNEYTDEEYKTSLQEIGGMDNLIPELSTKTNWSSRLSPGQQQKISFARALLIKPDWLFLDETTASLDNKSESDMYSILKRKLPKTTFISIAHRDSVERFHERIICLNSVDSDGFIVMDENTKKTQADNDDNIAKDANNIVTLA